VRDKCAACHLPRYSRLAIKFHTPDDTYVFPVRPSQHRIAVYPAARDEVLLAWHESQTDLASQQAAPMLKAALTSHWAQEAKQFESEHRLVAAIGAWREAVKWDAAPKSQEELTRLLALQTSLDRDYFQALKLTENQQYASAAELCESILLRDPSRAEVHDGLGTLRLQLGNQELAQKHWRKSAALDPDNAYGPNMLGWLAYQRGDAGEAVRHYQNADEVYPYTAEINFRWSLAQIGLRKWPEAEARLRKVLEIDPGHVKACQLLGHVLKEQGQAAAGLPFIQRAAKLTQFQDPDILLSLTDALAAAGRRADAAATATNALQLPAVAGSSFAAEFRQRLATLNDR